jgi:hypothetical protein
MRVVRGALRQRLLPGLHDVRRRVEIRVAAAHPDDVREAVGDVLQAGVDAGVLERRAVRETSGGHRRQSP